MCYRIELKTGIKEIGKRFKAVVDNPDSIVFEEEINGFAFPTLPVIIKDRDLVKLENFSWGLIPSWCKDDLIRKNTLNARIETLEDKPAFKDVITNRCLVTATGYFEWRWNDEKGKSKQKFEIHSAASEIFAFAGLYSQWNDPKTKQQMKTFSIVTTQANEQMEFIHNNKKRMPVMLKPEDELEWLDPKNDVRDFAFPGYEAPIIAFPI